MCFNSPFLRCPACLVLSAKSKVPCSGIFIDLLGQIVLASEMLECWFASQLKTNEDGVTERNKDIRYKRLDEEGGWPGQVSP